MGAPVVNLPPLLIAKLGLYQIMRNAGIKRGELAKRLGVKKGEIWRLLDPDYPENLKEVEAALKVVGSALTLKEIPKSSSKRITLPFQTEKTQTKGWIYIKYSQ